MNIAEYKRILGMIETIGQDGRSTMDCLIADLSDDIRDSIAGINTALFGVRSLCGISTKADWIKSVGAFVKEQTDRYNQIDRDFYHVLAYAGFAYIDDMIRNIQRNFLALDQVTRQGYISFYREFSYFFGELVPGDKKKGAIVRRVMLLKEKSEDFKWLYERLCDYRSKRVLSNILEKIHFGIVMVTMVPQGCGVMIRPSLKHLFWNCYGNDGAAPGARADDKPSVAEGFQTADCIFKP